jgi:hypothetical protein
MSTKARGIRDGSISETQLQPHMRGRLRRTTGASLTINTATTADALTAIAIYEGTGVTLTVPARSVRTSVLALTTNTLASAEVTDDDPFTFTSSESRTLWIAIDAVGNGKGSISVRVDDIDIASAPCDGGRCAFVATAYIATGSVMTLWFTADADCGRGLTTEATLTAVRCTISEGA